MDTSLARFPPVPRALGAVLYGKGEGIRGGEGSGGAQPLAWKTRDGRLWFSTPKGAAVVDPAHLETNTRVPPVILERIMVNGHPASSVEGIDFPAGSRNLEFYYMAPSLRAPEKVKFRYKLEGFDDGRVDAGTRRVAYYTNVPPGRYRFRVVASNDDGVWNRIGAMFAFRLRPYFHQTYWFYGLLALAALLLAIAAYRLKTSAPLPTISPLQSLLRRRVPGKSPSSSAASKHRPALMAKAGAAPLIPRPSSLRTVISPRNSEVTMLCTMDSPRPVPLPTSLVVKR